ncbi:MAG: hypothetical protein ACI914_000708 [Candidatus Marivariicella framensis]|jgi:hypothetical protein|tara:strand:- start:1088 stop:4318 length:3231 start_codon:yes stop_codon:yes gene_type:complete
MKKILILFFCLIFINCKNSNKTQIHDILFESLDSNYSGIDFINQLTYKPYLNIIEYLYYYNGGGVAVGDINNDGLEDIFFTANQEIDRLYLNMGNLQFRDITKQAKLDLFPSWSNGVTMDDVNNDGFIDIYVSKLPMEGLFKNQSTHNLLYINNGDLTFTESSSDYGLDFLGFSTQSTFFDYDRDGDLDMYLMNHATHSVRSYGTTKKRKEKDSISGDRFYENLLDEGKNKFIEVTDKSGILSSPLGYGLALTTTDINDDGWLDIYVGNDFHENDYLYINNGDKTFTESFKKYFKHSSRFTMGVDVADLNEDGKLDIFTTDMMPFDSKIALKSGGEDTDKLTKIKSDYGFEPQYSRNHFHLKKPYGDYAEIGLLTKTYATDWSWSVLLQDYDNDGNNDIFISNGIAKRPNDLDYINYLSTSNYSSFVLTKQNEMKEELINQMPELKIPNILFKNKGMLDFGNIKESFFGDPSYSNGSAYSDLDNDGDLDLIVNNINSIASILENKTSKENKSLTIELKNKKAIKGSRVTVFKSNNKVDVKEAITTRGFQSSTTHRLHFGLGKSIVDSISVRWADGKTQIVNGPFKEKIQIIYNSGKFKEESIDVKNNFSLSVLPFKHEEDIYLDYEREKLIPELLSSEGPAFLLADFNNDKMLDIFIGGARYRPSQILIATKLGYELADINDFRIDQKYEDVSAATFDADNDGDMDIYVVSGGNDYKENDELMMDRIYINDGNANFSRLSVALPSTNGSVVVSHDIDDDGYDDLFVGSRSIPGGYGLSPYSFIIKNTRDGNFEPIVQSRLGMVTDAKWGNIDMDPEFELIVVGDWTPIIVIDENEDGKFVASKLKGGENYYGLWNTIELADLNDDGKSDILVGNTGKNFKWQPTIESPVYLYVDDFDENEQSDPIIFYDFFGTYRPFNTKDNLGSQMPMIKKRFNKYKDFSKVETIENLTGKKEKNILEIKKLTELKSMLFINKGEDFDPTPLPFEAQWSSIQDFFWDKETEEIFYVGNSEEFVTELGAQSANPGGIIEFDNQAIHKEFLPLPINLNLRRVIKLNNDNMLLIANNDYIYILKRIND